jgi:hydrogenase maturation protease
VRPDLLIGLGNPLRGDDGVGARLVEELSGEGGLVESVALRTVHQLTPELALDVAEAGRVLIVDAWANSDGAEPWMERLRPPTPGAEDIEATTGGGHAWGPLALVALAEGLYGWRGEAALLRVPAFAFPHGTAFSAGLQAALPRARELLRRWLREPLEAEGPPGATTDSVLCVRDASPVPALPASAAPWGHGPVGGGSLGHRFSGLQPL